MKAYKCNLCGKTFQSPSSLNSHIRVHTGERPFKCQLCHKSFKLAWNVKAHVRCVHENTKPFKCPFCGFATNRRAYLDNHIRKHIRENPCHLCEREFSSSNSRYNHLRKFTHPQNGNGKSTDVQIDLNNVQPTGSTMAMKKEKLEKLEEEIRTHKATAVELDVEIRTREDIVEKMNKEIQARKAAKNDLNARIRNRELAVRKLKKEVENQELCRGAKD